MFQNIKVDIIYYKTNTDFEMEFNLCGCCRMRLLTDKSPDAKSLVHSLARAVSRSRVIMITGSLFSDDGIIKIAAEAIGSKIVPVNLSNYGVQGEQEIEIIEGSTPLVTPEGYFGGCIIEKGPQTMILLSDSKSVRKTIMQTLIHPYIEELCAIELQEKAAMATSPIITEDDSDDFQDAVEEVESDIIADVIQEKPEGIQEELLEDFIPITEEDEETLEEYDEGVIKVPSDMIIETEEEGEETPEEEEIIGDYFTEGNKMKAHEAERYNAEYTKYDYDDNGLIPEEEIKPNSRSLNITITVLAILILLVTAVLCYCLLYVPSKDGVTASTYIKEIVDIFKV